MPFDFKGSSSTPRPNSSSREDVPRSTTPSSFPRSGGSSSPGSGFQNIPSGRSGLPGQFPGKSSNVPTPIGQNGQSRAPKNVFLKRDRQRTASPLSGLQIPWRIVLPIIGIIAALVLCYIFRDAITAFLMQVLVWVGIILLVILIFKWIFRRRS